MKKRIICFILAFLMAMSVFSLHDITAYAASVEVPVTGGSIYFDTASGMVTGFGGSVSSVVLPEEINGVKVMGIGDEAFRACTSLTEVVLPEGAALIGNGAFYDCDNLQSITIPESVTAIGAGAFYFCRGLTEIDLPEGLTAIAPWTFGHCHGLQSIEIPQGVTIIGDSAFFSCESLTGVVIPQGVTTIENAAFSWCRYMTEVAIPEGVITIGDHAFSYCYSLKGVVIPDGVISLGSSAFSYGYDLTSVTMPGSVVFIGETAFEYCGSGMNLYYGGTEEQWAAISKVNNDFSGVTLHFDNTCEHNYEAALTEPTCTEDGFTTYTCALCGDAYVDAPTAALGHAWDDGKVTTEPTEESEGVRTFTCTRCGEEKTEAIPKKEHVHDYKAVITDPTCTEAGYTTYTCPCGDSYQDKETAALGHDYEEKVTMPTCTDGGFTTKTCTRCGDMKTGSETAALGHAWDPGKVTVEPTEEKEGIRTHSCTRCGEEKTEAIPKKDHVHDYKAVVTDPTCTEAGYTTHTCACGDSYKDTHTDPLKHSFTDGLCVRCGEADPDYEKPGHICPSEDFADVPAFGDWAHDGIDYCVAHELMNGVGGNLFDPNGTVSRAQLVTILYRVAGSPETEFKSTFTDVPAGQWYSAAIEWAAENGVVQGIGNRKFGPDLSITREQIATILYRYEKEPAVTGSLDTFPDHGKVSTFALNAMIWATQEELINGVSSNGVTTLAPQNNATRAQIASIIMRYLEAE